MISRPIRDDRAINFFADKIVPCSLCFCLVPTFGKERMYAHTYVPNVGTAGGWGGGDRW